MFEKINVKVMVFISSLLLFLAIVFSSIVGSPSAATIAPDIDDLPQYENMELGIYYYDTYKGSIRAIYIDPSREYHYDAIEEYATGKYKLLLWSSDGRTAPMWNRSFDGNQWYVVNSSSDLNNILYVSSPDDIYYSFSPIYNSDGSYFFHQATLAELVLAMVQEAIPIQVAGVQKTMATLALCGIGCLALLILLAILPKVLARFLG